MRTKAAFLHGRPSTSPHTTSLMTSLLSERAMSSRFRLLSSPIVQTLPGLSAGRERYFPFPVPESSPIHPAGKDERNCAMIGHGCNPVSRFSDSLKSGKSSYFISSRRKVRGNLIVDSMNVFFLVILRIGITNVSGSNSRGHGIED